METYKWVERPKAQRGTLGNALTEALLGTVGSSEHAIELPNASGIKQLTVRQFANRRGFTAHIVNQGETWIVWLEPKKP